MTPNSVIENCFKCTVPASFPSLSKGEYRSFSFGIVRFDPLPDVVKRFNR